MAANMYRVGDYVFFETSSTTPYQIRRIEELNKTQNGNVEAKVMCFYRRRDISVNLIGLADKHQSALEEGREGKLKDDLSEKSRHQLKHRELFLSRQVETLPATHIRGKCAVTLLNETESLQSYLNKECTVFQDAFFYSLVYDPQQKTLLADKGEIRVGQRYQAEVKVPLVKEGESDGRNLTELEQLVWSPDTNLTDKQIDQFMVIARSVGTFARALDCTSTVRQPSLHMSAAAASRDITLFHAMDTLHKHVYDVSKAIASLAPPSGPVLCRDEMEEWSASEANLFEEALDKYGKDFNDIRQDFLPWKSLKSIVEYYYMWKTTDRYVQQKRIKAAEAESKLKQVYIPNYNKPNPAQITGKVNGIDGQARPCESCYTAQSNQWYSWGPVHMQCRLCANCWIYWKKYGGLKMPTRLDGERPAPNQRQERLAQMAAVRLHRCTISDCGKEFRLKSHLARHLATAHGLAIRAGSPRPVMKTRAAFCLITTPLTRISRQHKLSQCQLTVIVSVSPDRHPTITLTNTLIVLLTITLTVSLIVFLNVSLNVSLIVFLNVSLNVSLTVTVTVSVSLDLAVTLTVTLSPVTGQQQLPGSTTKLKRLVARERDNLLLVAKRLGIPATFPKPDLLQHTEGARKEPAQYAFPALPAGQIPGPKPAPTNNDVPRAGSPAVSPSTQPSIMKKRGYEQTNGIDGPSPKRQQLGVIRQARSFRQTPIIRGGVGSEQNGRGKVVGRERKQILSMLDAPDDVYFIATDATRKLRKQLTSQEYKGAARKPWRKLKVKVQLQVLDNSAKPAPSVAVPVPDEPMVVV
ncbi:Metastasis-associated protein MTA1 [Lamellibrachia satsuma]|nr:Metastasis-associated protein MTA1 [Lamellibrachia satsuma]